MGTVFVVVRLFRKFIVTYARILSVRISLRDLVTLKITSVFCSVCGVVTPIFIRTISYATENAHTPCRLLSYRAGKYTYIF